MTATGNRRTYAGQSADERDALRRARLLAATRELIGTEGYAATTIERICSTAGVSTRHFYLLYANKEAAFVDLYETMTRQSYEHVLAALRDTEGKALEERVPAAFLAYLAPVFADPQAARIAFVEVMGVSPRMEATRLRYRESLIALVETEGAAAVRRGEIRPRDFRFAALAMIGAANTVVYDWAAHDSRRPASEVERQLADLAVTLLTG